MRVRESEGEREGVVQGCGWGDKVVMERDDRELIIIMKCFLLLDFTHAHTWRMQQHCWELI